MLINYLRKGWRGSLVTCPVVRFSNSSVFSRVHIISNTSLNVLVDVFLYRCSRKVGGGWNQSCSVNIWLLTVRLFLSVLALCNLWLNTSIVHLFYFAHQMQPWDVISGRCLNLWNLIVKKERWHCPLKAGSCLHSPKCLLFLRGCRPQLGLNSEVCNHSS